MSIRLFSLLLLPILIGHAPPSARETPSKVTLTEEMALARKEGIATTVEEFRKTLPPRPPDDQNAAPLYEQLVENPVLPNRSSNSLPRMTEDLLVRPTPKLIAQTKGLMTTFEDALELSEQIAARPYFWPDRKWENGEGVLYADLAQARSLAQFLLLNAALTVHEDNPAEARKAVEPVFSIISHCRQENLVIPNLVAGAVRFILLNNVALWCYQHPKEPIYQAVLDRALRLDGETDLQQERRHELYSWLLLMDQARTPEGRALVGMMEEERVQFEEIFTKNLSLEDGKAQLIRGYRRYWKALKPLNQREVDEGLHEAFVGMMASPNAVKILDPIISNSPSITERLQVQRARQMLYKVFLRAAKEGFPKRMDVSNDISPIDGKPIRYVREPAGIRLSAGAIAQPGEHRIEVNLVVPPRRDGD